MARARTHTRRRERDRWPPRQGVGSLTPGGSFIILIFLLILLIQKEQRKGSGPID